MIRVLIADDHGIVRSGLRMLIDRQTDMQVVAEADDGVAALESTQAHRPDVAVLDVSMPRMTGLQAAREIRSHVPETRVLLLSMHDDERYFLEGLDSGASGYVLKRAADTDLIGAVRTVAGGRTFLSSDAQRDLMDEWLEGGPYRARRSAHPARAGGGQADRRGVHQPPDRRDAEGLARRRWSPTAPTCSRSSACATAWSWCATRSGAGWSSLSAEAPGSAGCAGSA